METSEQRFRSLLAEAFDDLPAPPSPRSIQSRGPRRAPRKRVALLAIGVAVAIVVVGVTLATRRDGDSNGLETIGPTPQPLTVQQLVSATVTELAPPPGNLISSRSVQLLTIDRGLVLWGVRDPTSHQVTAARYSMHDDTWTTLDFPTMSRVPDDVSSGISVVSTGSELLLLGRENLALDLSTGKWRLLAEMPRPVPDEAYVFWTGRDAVVIGRAMSSGGSTFVGQAFDPGANKWRPIATPPQKIHVIKGNITAGSVLWTGTEALVYGIVDGATGPGGGNLTSYFAYNPATDRWRTDPSPFNGLTPESGATDGRTAYWARFSEVTGLELDAGQRINVTPLYGRNLAERLVVVGNQLANLDGTTLKVFDPATKKWIPGPQVLGHTAVVAADDIYVIEQSNPKLSRVAPG